MTTPAAGTDSIYLRLAGANRFTPRPKPRFLDVDWGGGFAAKGCRLSDRMEINGTLQLELCYSQAHFLLDWAFTRVNATGTSPWTTSEPPGDVPSCTMYHGIMRDDGSVKRRKYRGVKVQAARLSASADNGMTMLNLTLRAQKHEGNPYDASTDPDATQFPAPADTVFPCDALLFVHTAGAFKVGATDLAFLETADVNTTNAMDGHYYHSPFLVFDRLRGRASQLDLGVLYTAAPDWRTVMEAITAEPVSITWNNGTNTVKLDYHDVNYIDGIDDDLTPGRVYNQRLTLTTFYSPTAGVGPVFTYT